MTRRAFTANDTVFTANNTANDTPNTANAASSDLTLHRLALYGALNGVVGKSTLEFFLFRICEGVTVGTNVVTEFIPRHCIAGAVTVIQANSNRRNKRRRCWLHCLGSRRCRSFGNPEQGAHTQPGQLWSN